MQKSWVKKAIEERQRYIVQLSTVKKRVSGRHYV